MSHDCTPEQDELVREFCRENDVGAMKGCPKCGMGTNENLVFGFFCTHGYCPIREWRQSIEDNDLRR